jgi:isocitrate/isopropylmalate dehydrogenase
MRIENAITKTLADGYRTGDIAKFGAKVKCSTSQMGDMIAQNI